MKNFIQAFIALFLITLTGFAHASSARQPGTVVELFTSQGCSSCPPADKILGDLINDPDVLGLSYSVTYWDYIGWKDTFGDAKNDARQTHYRDQMDARYVYTPQMVIAGKQHFVGSNKSQLEDNLHQYRGHAKSIPLSWRFEGNKLFIELPTSTANAVIWQVDIDHSKAVKIRRGENHGKTVTYHNVAREMRNIGAWNGQKKVISLDLSTLRHEGRDGCAILVQEKGYGPIVAALVIDL